MAPKIGKILPLFIQLQPFSFWNITPIVYHIKRTYLPISAAQSAVSILHVCFAGLPVQHACDLAIHWSVPDWSLCDGRLPCAASVKCHEAPRSSHLGSRLPLMGRAAPPGLVTPSWALHVQQCQSCWVDQWDDSVFDQ